VSLYGRRGVVESTWERDRGVLRAIVEAEQEGRLGNVGLRTLAERTGLDESTVGRVLERLDSAGFVEVRFNRGDDRIMSARVVAVRERGLRESGAWPLELDFAGVLEIIERLAEQAPPGERSRWRKLAEGVASGGREVLVQFLAALARHGAGLE
jgi:DNA-binding MarR family transcriptional regulator